MDSLSKPTGEEEWWRRKGDLCEEARLAVWRLVEEMLVELRLFGD